MNPLNATQQHPQATQFFVTGMPPLASAATSILKSNVSAAVSSATQQHPTIVTAINNLGSNVKCSTTGNNIMNSAKYITTGTNYMPVLLTNQTLISTVDPIKYQQQQHPTKMMGIAPVVTSSSTSANISIMSGNVNKPMVINATTSTASKNVSYQVLSTSQNNNLTPVIAAPNGTVSVLLTSTQPMSTTGHVAAPIIIRNTPTTTATTNKTVQIQQQLQLPARQQQQLQQQKQLQHQQQQTIKFNTFNPQSMNAEILKQIVVGNTGTGSATILAPGTTLLKPTILQNKPIIQQKQQQIQSKSVKSTTMMITTNPQQQQHQHQLQQNHSNHTIITTTSDNSSQMFAAFGMELVKSSNAAQTVQKLPQVSLLQNSAKKSSNISEINIEPLTVLKNSNEIKVGNLNSEVSLIKKPNLSSVENKSKESSLLKTSNKLQEVLENPKQDLDKSLKLSTITANNKDAVITNKDLNESCSLLKSYQDLKQDNSDIDNINNKSANVPVEKQKSLLKPQICNIKQTEFSDETNEQPHLTSSRSHRSNSYNNQKMTSPTVSTEYTERRHSEPSKTELEMFFEDEEYLESSGDKSSSESSEKSNDNCNKNLLFEKEKQENAEHLDAENNQQTNFPKTKQVEATNSNNSQEKHSEQKNDTQEKEEINKPFTDNKPIIQEGNEEEISEDDEVTILPAEEVEIEQIEIDDDDDEDEIEKNIPHIGLRTPSVDKEQLNESLLCDEQLIISSSSSISNISSDQSSTMASMIKSPRLDNTTTAHLLKKTLMEPKAFNSKEGPQSNGYSSVLAMLSNFNMLNWRERIGNARGTNLKFQLNEFNLIQLYEKNMSNKRIHTAYEKPIYERESSQKRNEHNEPPTYYMCRRCNVQGPSVDFLAPEFCSLSCLKRDCRKRRDDSASLIRKRNRVNNVNNFSTNKNANTNYVNEASYINNPPPLSYIRKPKFRWTTYMNRNYNVIAAPISLFLNPFPTGPNNFLVGMKLEAIDPENCSLFCVCTVVSIMGYRLKLSFDGYSNAYDFWVNADSMDIFPPGWCAKTNRILQPPKGIAANKFNWGAYFTKERALPAPRMLFTHLNSSSLVPHNPFKIGMHLEAEDLNDTGKLCVASVADVLDDRIRIHFDGWDDCYDIIEDINSPYIHPCGWHEGRQQLVVPPDCENTAFNWIEYIRSQGTGEAASEELFAPREPIGFKTNMRLEVVDPRNPSLIRPASVVSHKGHRVKLHLDGWPSDYCFWLEDDSPDLHPIGWCDATGHDLEPPPGFQILKQKFGCTVDGCRGIGNAKNGFKNFHASRDGCPYAAENWRTVVEKPPRVSYENIVKSLPKQSKLTLAQQVTSLQSRFSEQQILERLQMLDNIKTRNVLIQQDKLPSNHSDNILCSLPLPHLKKEEIKEAKSCKTSSSTSPSPSTSCTEQQISANNTFDVNLDIAREYLYDYGPRLQQNFNLWQRNFSFDADKIKRNPLTWSTTEVSVFVDLYLNCRKTASLFSHEDVNGEAFLLLQQQDLTEHLGLKLGPAIKLYTCILQLRTLAVTKFNVPYKSFSVKK